MNVVAIVPTPAAGTEAVRYWHQRLTPNDILYVMSIVGSKEQSVCGVEIQYLQLDGIKGLQWRSRFVRGIGWRLVSGGYGLWHSYLLDIWPELLWNIQSLDADVIDLRALPRNEDLQKQLRGRPWCVVGSDKDLPKPEAVSGWRTYHPNQKISIVLPVYNGEDFLEQSIKSCLEQTHRDIELVIVDDCSKDRTPAIIAKYAALDPRIVSIRNPVNQRLPRSLNIGFAATTGELLTWTSHDNYYDPNGLESLARYLSTWRDVDLVYCDYRQFDETRQMQLEVKRLWPPWQLPIRNVVGAYFLFRRSVYQSVGDHRVDMEYAEDYDFWVRTYKSGFSLMQLHNPLYTYRLHSQSMTAEAEKMRDRPHVGSQVRRGTLRGEVLKIVHISANDIRGGAARAAFRLHTGLRQMGHTSSMIVAEHSSSDPDVKTFEAPANWLKLVGRRLRRAKNQRDISRYRSSRPTGYDMFSSDLRCPYGAELLLRLPPYDVINLHWIACFVDIGSFVSAVPPQVPVFWKLDDMNPFTGGCHFDHDCGKHMTGCGGCPQLGSHQQDDLSNQVWKRKKAYYGRLGPEKLHLVALNNWMARKVSNNPLLGKFQVTVVPNGLDTEVFAPRERFLARQSLGIPQDARVILFAAETIDNKRKGFELLVQALAGIRDIDKLFLLSVGTVESPIELEIPHLNLGYVNDEQKMSFAYSAADLYAISSVHDNQPNTVVEAMACGTPVVGFEVGGIPELVKPGVTGLLAKGGDVAGLRDAIAELLKCDSKRESMKVDCRETVLREFNLELQCKRYANLYEIALKDRQSVRPN